MKMKERPGRKDDGKLRKLRSGQTVIGADAFEEYAAGPVTLVACKGFSPAQRQGVF